MRQNSASVIRIQPEQIAEFEEEEDEGACYALQLSNGRIVFINGQQYHPSARFPNSDFSLVDIGSEDGTVAAELIEKRGHKIQSIRTIPAKNKATLKIPQHLEVISGDVRNIEQLLS